MPKFRAYSPFEGCFSADECLMMNASKAGRLQKWTGVRSAVLSRREEKALTQAALAEKLGVSNKTVSKWETGKCMPDDNVIRSLCSELEITVSELMDAEERTADVLSPRP